MSRARKARARERRRLAAAPPPAAAKPQVVAKPQATAQPRVRAARRRIAAAKVGVLGVAIVGFGAALGFSRLYYAGHPKQPLQPLAAPPRYVQIVRQNLLEAGIVAPAEAPPGAATSTS
jgi:hypothetical protein